MDEKLFSEPGSSAVCLLQLRFKAMMENVPVATQRIAQAARDVGFAGQALYQIELAVDEACANVVEHAYPGVEQGEMEICCYLEDRTLVIRVRDWGTGFDPDAVEEPAIDAPLEERSLGGLGLFLVQQIMDHVTFSFDPQRGSELLMFKRLEFAA